MMHGKVFQLLIDQKLYKQSSLERHLQMSLGSIVVFEYEYNEDK